jgi:hypothetical protein
VEVPSELGNRKSLRRVIHYLANTDFPTGKTPIREGSREVKVHRVSENCDARCRESQIRDHAIFRFPDRVKGGHRRSILWVQSSPDKGFEEQFSSSGLEEKKVLVGADVPGGRSAFQRQAKDQKLGSNDCKNEGKVHPEGLSDHTVQEDAEPETEVDDGEGVYRRILQAQYQSRSSGER